MGLTPATPPWSGFCLPLLCLRLEYGSPLLGGDLGVGLTPATPPWSGFCLPLLCLRLEYGSPLLEGDFACRCCAYALSMEVPPWMGFRGGSETGTPSLEGILLAVVVPTP